MVSSGPFPHETNRQSLTQRKEPGGGWAALPVAALLSLALLGSLSCAKPERWSAMIYEGETAFYHRDAGIYPTVEECLKEGKKQKGKGFLECGLNCRWTAQGLLDCEKTVRLMEHSLPAAATPAEAQPQAAPAKAAPARAETAKP